MSIINRQTIALAWPIVAGTQYEYRMTICAICPWRRDAVGQFSPESFIKSAAVGYDCEATDVSLMPDAHCVFICPSASKERPVTCAGYILQGRDSISWQLAVMRECFDPDDVVPVKYISLFWDYYEMALANGASPDHPEITRCRHSSGPQRKRA